jgi:hypothetical protein
MRGERNLSLLLIPFVRVMKFGNSLFCLFEILPNLRGHLLRLRIPVPRFVVCGQLLGSWLLVAPLVRPFSFSHKVLPLPSGRNERHRGGSAPR